MVAQQGEPDKNEEWLHGDGRSDAGRETGQRMKDRERSRWRELGSALKLRCCFLFLSVRGFVPWPSRKWELGRQQLTKGLWRIQLAINGQPQAFVLVTMETAQHHYTQITKPFLQLSFFTPELSLRCLSGLIFLHFETRLHLVTFVPLKPFLLAKATRVCDEV